MKKKVVNSQLCNMQTYAMYRRQLLNLAENVFNWKNMPEYIDIGYLNRILVEKGSIAFFKDEYLGVLALPYSTIGTCDIYGRPNTIMVHAFNGRYYRRLNKGEFVIMYDNNGRYPIFMDILQFAERIAMNKRTIDINIVQQRTPRIWKTSEDKKRSLLDTLQQIDSLNESVVSYDSLEIEDMTAVLAPAPYVADKLDQHLEKEWGEFFRLIGVANLIEQKKERVIKDEIATSQGGTVASRYSRFESRRFAVDEINKKWNTNIEFEFYDGKPTTIESDIEEVENDDVSMLSDDVSISAS